MKNSKRNWPALLIFVFTLQLAGHLSFARVEAVIGPVALDKNPNLWGASPSTSASEIIISRDQYVLSYNKERRAVNWAAWKLEAKNIGHSGRSNKFIVDQDLEDYLTQQPGDFHAVSPTDFKGSCFDRGHQVPSADRTDSVKNNEVTFEMSNMIPQTPYLNRVVWEHLEQYTRDLVQQQNKKIYVIAGPIYDEDFGSIGPDKDIPVPSKDFKVLIVLDANQTPADINSKTPVISVVMPNTLKDGSKPLDDEKALCHYVAENSLNRGDWEKYKTTLQEVERVSGLSLQTLTAHLQ